VVIPRSSDGAEHPTAPQVEGTRHYLWRLLTQLHHPFTVEFLPVVVPTEAERGSAALFAESVSGAFPSLAVHLD